MTDTIVIPYAPQPYQREIHYSPARFRVVCDGRRGGKTEAALNEVIRQAVKKPGQYWYVSPSYRQSKQIAWHRLKQLLRNDEQWKYNEQELAAFHPLINTRIELKGADNEDSLRGVGLNGVVLDECATMKPNVWPEIVRPMLADTGGWALFIGTPKGKNWFYDLWAASDGLPGWQRWHYPTSINRYVAAEELEQMKREMPERLYKQEVLAEFLDDEAGVFRKLRQAMVGDLAAPVLGRLYLMGVDLARTEDFTVLTVVDTATRQVVAWQRFNSVSWPEQKLRIQDLAARYNHAICWVDSTGVGEPIYEDLLHSGVSCEAVKFTNEIKKQMVENLALALEQRFVTFPASLEVLHQELSDFEYTIGDKGRIFYQAPEGSHDDCVISLALAAWGLRPYLREAQRFQPVDELDADRQGRGTPVVPQYEFAGHGGY